jgi:hypothetical protein
MTEANATPITDTAPPIPTRRQRLAAARRRRLAVQLAQKREAKRIAAEAEEARQESIAPSVQRAPVMAPDGTILRGARLEPDGLAFRVSNPIRHLVARGERQDGTNLPLITRAHQLAAERLVIAWEEGGRSVTMAACAYGERSGGGSVTSGSPSDAVLASIGHQNRMLAEFTGARAWLGGLFTVIDAVVLRGIDVSAWAKQERRDRKAAVGYLAAALDRLVEFYAEPVLKPVRMRAVEVV